MTKCLAVLLLLSGVLNIVFIADICRKQSQVEDLSYTLSQHFEYDSLYNSSECMDQVDQVWDYDVPGIVEKCYH